MKRHARRRTDYATEQARRIDAGRLFARGLSQAELVPRLTVSGQSVSRWLHPWEANGEAGLRKAGRTGRRCRLSEANLCHLEALPIEGPRAQGYETNLWTLQQIARLI